MRTRVYTDGACSGNPGPGGWAAVILGKKDRVEISGYELQTTNNRMELKAVIEAIKLAKELEHKRIEICSDSAYVINAIKKEWIFKWRNNNWKTSQHEDVKNKDLWLELIDVIKVCSELSFVKVKGHDGDVHNEAADMLARREVERIKALDART